MVRNEFTFPSTDGKNRIHAVEWLPDGEVRAVLQIAHGVSEYILRYEPFAAYLTERGFAVVGHDHLGHGSSIAPGGKPMYFGPKGSWNWVVQDMEQRRALAREKFPALPYFLLGHSMGSFLTRTYLIRHPGKVDGAVVMGTGQMIAPLVAGGKLVAAAESLRVGEENASPIVQMLAFGSYNKIFAPNRTGFDWLSVNPENVDRYIADPLCGGNPSIGLFREMLGGISFIGNPEHIKQMDPTAPILLISGAMDPVGDCGKGVRRVYDLFRKAGIRNVTLKLYPELRHEILCETDRETVFEDVFRWLCSQIPVNT